VLLGKLIFHGSRISGDSPKAFMYFALIPREREGERGGDLLNFSGSGKKVSLSNSVAIF
jgi:hypothetical protein